MDKNLDSLVSIIMPAYNSEKYLAESINSVINQTYKNWELIIVDDGSTDNTKTIIDYFVNYDKRIKYLYQLNGKQGKARNLGIANSSGEYIAFLDSDDIWLPLKLEAQINEIKLKNVDLVFSDACYFINNENPDFNNRLNSHVGYCFGESAIKLFLFQNRIPILTVLVKSKSIYKSQGFVEKISLQNIEDYHLWIKLLLDGNIFYGSNNIYALYRVHDQSATFNDRNTLDKKFNMIGGLCKKRYKYSMVIRKELILMFIEELRKALKGKKNINEIVLKYLPYLWYLKFEFFKLLYSRYNSK